MGLVAQVEKEIVECTKEKQRLKLEIDQFEKETIKEIEATEKLNDLTSKIRKELINQKVKKGIIGKICSVDITIFPRSLFYVFYYRKRETNIL